MPIPDENVQEQLSLAYCSAIITYAGFTFDRPGQGNDFGLDGYVNHHTFYNGEYLPNGSVFYVQIKASYNFTEKGDIIKYPLKMKAHRKLKSPSTVPQVLILYTMSPQKADWINHNPERLLLQKCAYWIPAQDIPDSNNGESVVIDIPKKNIFNSDTVHELAKPTLERLKPRIASNNDVIKVANSI